MSCVKVLCSDVELPWQGKGESGCYRGTVGVDLWSKTADAEHVAFLLCVFWEFHLTDFTVWLELLLAERGALQSVTFG